MTNQNNTDQPEPYLAPCPFCGSDLHAQWDRKNPKAQCQTDRCKGAQLPLLNLDMPDDIAAWNTRAPQPSEAVRDAALDRARSLREVTCKKCELRVISSCGGDGYPVKDRYADLRAPYAQPGTHKKGKSDE